MTTAVAICSQALLMLGDKPISSFDENTDRALVAANLYPTIRNYLLRSHPWNCATKRVVLSPDTSAPAFGFAYRFRQPDDWMRTLQVGQYDTQVMDFRHESGWFLSDEAVFYLRYIWRNEDESTWDALLIHAAVLSMRQVFAYPITASGTLEELVTTVVRNVLKEARAVDGQDQPAETFGDFPLLASRYGGRRF